MSEAAGTFGRIKRCGNGITWARNNGSFESCSRLPYPESNNFNHPAVRVLPSNKIEVEEAEEAVVNIVLVLERGFFGSKVLLQAIEILGNARASKCARQYPICCRFASFTDLHYWQ